MTTKELNQIVKTAVGNGMSEDDAYKALLYGYMAHYAPPVESDCVSPGIPCELCQQCGRKVVPATINRL